LHFNFWHQKVSQRHVQGGSTSMDADARGDCWVRSNLGLSASVQYRRWLFPVIQPNAERNVTATVGILLHPRRIFQRFSTNATRRASGNGGRP
jgi:hypothetical protein